MACSSNVNDACLFSEAGYVDPRRHGAVGDGEADDTPAFQAALAFQAAQAALSGPGDHRPQAPLALLALHALQGQQVEVARSPALAGVAAALPELLRESHPRALEGTDSAREA